MHCCHWDHKNDKKYLARWIIFIVQLILWLILVIWVSTLQAKLEDYKLIDHEQTFNECSALANIDLLGLIFDIEDTWFTLEEFKRLVGYVWVIGFIIVIRMLINCYHMSSKKKKDKKKKEKTKVSDISAAPMVHSGAMPG